MLKNQIRMLARSDRRDLSPPALPSPLGIPCRKMQLMPVNAINLRLEATFGRSLLLQVAGVDQQWKLRWTSWWHQWR